MELILISIDSSCNDLSSGCYTSFLAKNEEHTAFNKMVESEDFLTGFIFSEKPD